MKERSGHVLWPRGKTAMIYTKTLKTHHHNFAIFSQTVNAIENLLAAFNVLRPKLV